MSGRGTTGYEPPAGFCGRFLLPDYNVTREDGTLDNRGVLVYHRPYPGGMGGLDEKT